MDTDEMLAVELAESEIATGAARGGSILLLPYIDARLYLSGVSGSETKLPRPSILPTPPACELLTFEQAV